MPQREINAKQIIGDIRSRADDIALMEKYGLSSHGLEILYKVLIDTGLLRKRETAGSDLPPPPRSSAVNLVADIREGVRTADLVQKYGLSPSLLQRIAKQLGDARVLAEEHLDHHPGIRHEAADHIRVRQVQRYHLDFELPVYESANPENQGLVRDVSEQGFGVTGLQVPAGCITGLVILGDPLGEVASFEFEAQCRWIQPAHGHAPCAAGFVITTIKEADMLELLKLIELASLRG